MLILTLLPFQKVKIMLFLCQHLYSSVKHRISQSTAAPHSTGSFNSKGRDFGITHVHTVLNETVDA